MNKPRLSWHQSRNRVRLDSDEFYSVVSETNPGAGVGIMRFRTKEEAEKNMKGILKNYPNAGVEILPPAKKNPRQKFKSKLRASFSGRKARIRMVEKIGGKTRKGTSFRILKSEDPRKLKRIMHQHKVRVNPSLKKRLAAKKYSSARIQSEYTARMEQTRGLRHHVCVKANGKTIAQMRDTPEMRFLAMRFAKTYKRKHPGVVVSVVAY